MSKAQIKERLIASGILEPVIIVERSRARRLNLSILADGSLRVVVPRACSQIKAYEFIIDKRQWIARKRQEAIIKKQRASEIYDAWLTETSLADAKCRLAGRTRELAERNGLVFAGLSFRQQRRRWGSCSAKNHLSLNLKLDLLPTELSDYVILHELAHTRIKNHGPEFWLFMEKLFPGASGHNRRLRDFSGLLQLTL